MPPPGNRQKTAMAQNHALAGTSTAITILRDAHDPIFELIELYRRAYFVFAAHGAAVEMVENDSKKRPLKTLWPASEADKALAHGYDEGDEMERSVKKLIIATPPTTPEGLRVAVDYVADYLKNGCPNDKGFDHLPTIAASLEIISRGLDGTCQPSPGREAGGGLRSIDLNDEPTCGRAAGGPAQDGGLSSRFRC